MKKTLLASLLSLFAINANAQVVIQPSPNYLLNPIITGQIFASTGSAALPSYSFLAAPTTGTYYNGSNGIRWTVAGGAVGDLWSGGIALASNVNLAWSSGVIGGSLDTIIARSSAGIVRLSNSASVGALVLGSVDASGVRLINTSGTFDVKDGSASNYVTTRAQTFNAIGGTVTASTPILSATQTWNNAGVTFKGTTLTFTETASGASSRYFEIFGGAAGTTDAFYIGKGGNTFIGGALTVNTGSDITSGANVFAASSGRLAFSSRSRIGSSSNGLFEFYDSGEGNGVQLNVGTTDGTVFFRTRAGADSAKVKANELISTGNISASGLFRDSTYGTRLNSPGDGYWNMTMNAGTGVQMRFTTAGTMEFLTTASADTAIVKANILNATGKYQINGTDGVSCASAGTVTSTFGIITACSAPSQLMFPGFVMLTSDEYSDFLSMRNAWKGFVR